MKKSKRVASREYLMLPVPTPKRNTPVFMIASIVFGAIFIFTLGFSIYGNLTGQAILSASSGGSSSMISKGNIKNPTCYDSNENLSWPEQYFVKGYCIDSYTNVTLWDFCGNATNGSNTCFKYYCNYQNRCAIAQMNCADLNGSTGQCSNGACVRKPTALTGSSGSSGPSAVYNVNINGNSMNFKIEEIFPNCYNICIQHLSLDLCLAYCYEVRVA